jgi:hypothetical protein
MQSSVEQCLPKGQRRPQKQGQLRQPSPLRPPALRPVLKLQSRRRRLPNLKQSQRRRPIHTVKMEQCRGPLYPTATAQECLER